MLSDLKMRASGVLLYVCVVQLMLLLLLNANQVTGEELRYYVTEGDDAGFVGNPVVDSKLSVAFGSLSKFQFNFVSPNNSQSRFFTVNHMSGEIQTQEPLDREIVCVVGACPINLDVAVQSATSELELIQILRVRIHVHDVNDNTPTFPSSTVEVAILESTPTETTFPVPVARDADTTGNNSRISYELHSSSGIGKFGLSVIKNWDGSTDIGIVVKQNLNREELDFYQVRIIAKDHGTPSLTGTLSVNITVTDSNDHIPVFVKPLWNVTIFENVTTGTEILRLSTNDRDIGANGQVTYSFNSRSASKIGSVFSVDKTTGAIKVIGPVDFESTNVYQLMVEAKDNGVPPKSSRSAVIINVLDVNDNPPDIAFNLLAGGDHALVSEFANPGSFVGHVSVDDPDSDQTQRISCQMDSSEFSLQRISDKEYKIILLTKLDRESHAEYNLSVGCEDNATPSLKVTKVLLVVVKDENDHPPVFQQAKYSMSIPEDYPIAESIINVFADDVDVGENGNVSYGLVNNLNDTLSIDSSTGVIVASKSLDRENGTSLSVNVIAVDNGSPKLTATSTVVLTLTDVNDVSPVFTKSEYEIKITENEYVHTDLRPLKVTDPDLGSGGEFYFTLLESTAPSGVFLVSQMDGSIKTVEKFDREERDEYRLVVMATDRGTPALSSSATVLIRISDVNDNDPIILYPSNSNNSVDVISWKVDTFVAEVSGFDRDAGENGRLSYRIENDEAVGFLYIDADTGVIRLAQDIDEDFAGRYEVTVVAQDNGTPVKSTRQTLNVMVTPVNGTAVAVNDKSSNMSIVIAVVAITVIVSLAILIGICVVRKQDRKKRNQPPKSEERKIMQRRGSSSTASKASQQSDLSTVTCLDELRKDVSFTISDDSQGFPSGRNNMAPCYLLRSQNQGLPAKDSAELQILNTTYLDRKYDVLGSTGQVEDDFGNLYSENNNMIRYSPNSSDTLTNSDSGRGGSDDDLNDKVRISAHPESQWSGDHYVRFIRSTQGESESQEEKARKLSSFRKPSTPSKHKEENYYYDMTVIRKSILKRDKQTGKPAGFESNVPPSSRPVSLHTEHEESPGLRNGPGCDTGRSVSQTSLPPYYMKPFGDKPKLSRVGGNWSRTDSRSCSIEMEDLNTSTCI